MPEISFSPTNQCTIDDPTDGAGLDTIDETPAAPPEPLVPFAFRDDWGTQGAGGGSNANDDGGEGGSDGQSGSSLLVDRTSSRDPCLPETLSAIGTCGAAVVLTLETGGLAAVFGLFSCAGAIANLDRCLENNAPSVR